LRGPRFNQSSLVIEAAVAGRGVALAKRTIASADLAAGRLVAPISGPDAPVGFSYFLVWPTGRELSPAQSTFVDWLRDQARGAEPSGVSGEEGEAPVFAGHSI
jgi:LysR family glycine cleavage system transcriptional activator